MEYSRIKLVKGINDYPRLLIDGNEVKGISKLEIDLATDKSRMPTLIIEIPLWDYDYNMNVGDKEDE